uniref:p6 protein n=1 Tax=Emaravirus toordali TaxID=1980430 RepID=A0A219T3W9_9VIRU|nr:p6 protein [Emaravirus toordali]
MASKGFEKTFNICNTANLEELYSELESQLYYSAIEYMLSIDLYGEIAVLREIYEDNNLDLSTLVSNAPYLIIEGNSVSRKSVKYFTRYLQFSMSLFGVSEEACSDLCPDYHIFGSVHRQKRILPYIPNNSKYLLVDTSILKESVWDVMRGVDPYKVLERVYLDQPRSMDLSESTVAFNFHIMAISYISIRSSSKLKIECKKLRLSSRILSDNEATSASHVKDAEINSTDKSHSPSQSE